MNITLCLVTLVFFCIFTGCGTQLSVREKEAKNLPTHVEAPSFYKKTPSPSEYAIYHAVSTQKYPSLIPDECSVMYDLEWEITHLEKSEIIVVACVTNVTRVAITGMDDYNISIPTHWYRIRCSIIEILKGELPHKTLEFYVCSSGYVKWPYIKGAFFCIGMQREQTGVCISAQVRTSPFPPYKITDHLSLGENSIGAILGTKMSLEDQRWVLNLINKWRHLFPERDCIDISLEAEDTLIFLFTRNDRLGFRSWDEYVEPVVVSIPHKQVVFPLAILSWYNDMSGVPEDPLPMDIDEFESIF